MDHALLKALVERFGSLRCFAASPSGDQVLVSYMHAEDAMQTQRALSAGVPGGLPPLAIDFISDMDLMQSGLIPPAAAAGPRGIPPDFAPSQPAGVESGWPAGLGGTAFGGGSAGSVWSTGGAGGGVEDHSSFLPSDLFSGGQ